MNLSRASALPLAFLAFAGISISYLAVETLDAFAGARYGLPLSVFLVVSKGLRPLVAGSITLAVLLASISGLLYWLFRHTPTFLSRQPVEVSEDRKDTAEARTGTKIRAKAETKETGGMKVDEFDLNQNAETRPFVDVVQLEQAPLNIYAAVTKDEGREGYTYVVIEPSLTEEEKVSLAEIKKLLVDELDVDLRSIDDSQKAETYLSAKTKDLAKKYGYKITEPTMTKLLYFLTRDFIHLGKIEPLMRDKHIEDISCDGAGIPIYIWYRDYESIPTNIVFETNEELDTFVSKLAYSAGKHVSLAEPIVDASFADGSRLHLTFGKEITQRGSTFTIRKFRVDPLTIVDLIRYNTLSSDIAAYLWYLIEKKLALLVAGGTASGKSIPYHEKVLVYKDGRPALTSIGRFYDEMAASRSATIEGTYETISCRGVETAAFDSNLKVGRHQVLSVVRHPAPRRIYRVRTRSGRGVEATGDHSIFTIAGGEVTEYPASKLSPGMFVAVPRSIPATEVQPASIDLLDLLRNSRRQIYVENVSGVVWEAIQKLGLAEVARVLGVRRRSVREGVKQSFLVAPLKGLMDLADKAQLTLNPETLWMRSKTNASFKLGGVLAVGKPLARFLGFWAAEGMYQEKGVSLFQLDPQTRRAMLDCAFAAFGITGKASKGADRTRLDFNSGILQSVISELFGQGSGSASKRIPKCILAEGNEILAEFLRAYFTGDASAGTVIEATTKSEQLADELLYALLRFEIVGRITHRFIKGKKYFRVFIFGQPNIRKFEERIGFLDSRRQATLAKATAAEIQPHTNLDTIPGITPLLKEALAFKTGQEKREFWSDWHSYWSPTKTKSMSPRTLMQFVSQSGARNSVERRLLRLANADIFWDEVVDVQVIDYSGEYVYDLEVPDAENFVGGAGGIFLHNTTSLNALSMFIEPGEKIVSIEDTPELNLPHENWIQSVTRGVGTAGEITMFDLVKASLRQRPDVLIVGEVRGEEAFTLLQSIATGHGGLGTIHADSVEAVINRLTTEPMNIPRSLVGTTLDCIVLQLKIRLSDKSVRRVVAVTEVVGHDSRTDEIVLNDAFRWDPTLDKFVFTGRSKLFDKITQKFGTRPDEIRREIDGRRVFLDWLAMKNIRSHTEVSEQIREFYAGQYAVINKARAEMEELKA